MIPGDPAYYRGTDVLINKHDLRDPDLAAAVEYKFAFARELELHVEPIQGNFDFDHLKSIHRHLFQDTYDWAGEVREIDFAKRSKETGMVSRFTKLSDMDKKVEEFNRFIADNKQLKGLAKPEFIKLFAEAHAKLNEIHPFREGNGRSTRIFLSQLAKEAGHELRIDKLDKDKWNLASHKAMKQEDPKNPDRVYAGNQSMMREVLGAATRPHVEHAFVHESRDSALKLYPDLKAYYDRLDSITAKARSIGPPETAEKLIAGAQDKMVEKLRSDRIELQRNEALERLAEVRPDVKGREGNVYGPRENYQIVGQAIEEVYLKKGHTQAEASAVASKARQHLEAAREQRERTMGPER